MKRVSTSVRPRPQEDGGLRVGAAEFRRVLAAVRATGVPAQVEELLRPDPAKGGRRRQLPVDVFLTALVLTAYYGQKVLLTRVHNLLTEGLARSLRVELGLTGAGRPELTIRQVRYVLEAIERRLAYSQGRAPDLAEEDRAYREQALLNLMNLLLSASTPDHLPAPREFATDACGLDSWERRRRKKGTVDDGADHAGDAKPPKKDTDSLRLTDGRFPDPDARVGYRTRTTSNPTTWVNGYHALALVSLGTQAGCDIERPKLTYALTLTPANANAVEPAVKMVDSHLQHGGSIDTLINDRDFSYKVPETWAGPLRDRGIRQVLDMRADEHGPLDHHGILFLDGSPHCPQTPKELHVIERPANLSAGTLPANPTPEQARNHATRVRQIEEFRAKIAQRRQYAFERNQTLPSGSEQYICPARSGKLVCAHCPLSQAFTDEDVPVVSNPPVLRELPDAPERPGPGSTAAQKDAYKKAKARHTAQADHLRCCRQETITIPMTAAAKHRQDMYWGSDEWIRDYSRRTDVESAFGQLVGPDGGHVVRGWTRVMGIVKTTIMLTAAVIAVNIRALRAWARRTGDMTNPLTQELPASLGWEELDVIEDVAGPNAPPAAA